MSYAAKLVRGSAYLDLTTGGYSLGADFVPPGTVETAFLAGGTSANRSRGADLIGVRAENRSWSFSVRCLGSVSAETHSLASRLVSFLVGAADTRLDKTYFEYRPDADLPEPVWGTFGVALRYEIVHATTALDRDYARGRINRNAIVVMVNLTIKPFAQNKPMPLAFAQGGLVEDRIGMPDRVSRGVIVAPGTTNLIKNPIFGHATPPNGWTLTLVSCTSNNPVRLFGSYTERLYGPPGKIMTTAEATSATASHTLSCYAKRVDGGVVDATVLKLGDNTTQWTTLYRAVGDGWYRLTYTAIFNTATAYTLGVYTQSLGISVYVTGFQFEQKPLATPLCWGNQLGCTWSGTPHDSSSTRTAGFIKVYGDPLANAPLKQRGTIRTTVILPQAATNGDMEVSFFAMDAAGASAKLEGNGAGQQIISCTVGTVGTITSGLKTLVSGDPLTIHVVWSATEFTLYINGVLEQSLAGNASKDWTTVSIATNTATSIGAAITDFVMYDQALTGVQVAADYARILPLRTTELNISRIPYTHVGAMATPKLENILDATRRNYAVISGVPGTADAIMDAYFDMPATWFHMILSLYESKNFVDPNLLYADFNSTADAACSGGGYGASSVTTSFLKAFTTTFSQFVMEAIAGKNVYILARMDDTGTGLSVYAEYDFGDSSKVTDPKPFTDTAAFQYFLSNPLFIGDIDSAIDLKTLAGSFSVGLKRASGTNNVNLDFFEVLAGKILKVITTDSSTDKVLVRGAKANSYSTHLLNPIRTVGEELTLTPDSYNVLTASFDQVAITTAATIEKVYITPRWHLL